MNSSIISPPDAVKPVPRPAVRGRTAALCGVLLLAALPLGAQSTAPSAATVSATADADDQPVVLEALEVEGIREGISKARQQQRDAINLKEILAVDAVGKLPDSNIAEALQRVPGVYVDSSHGDGRYVSIRGVDPILNNVTMNGQTIAVSDVDGRSGRAAPLDVLSASALGSLEVVKAQTPDMDGQGLGGTINIMAPSAFSHDGTFAYGTTKGGFNDEIAGMSSLETDLTFGTRFGSNQQFGILIGVNYLDRDFQSFDASGEGHRIFGRTPNSYFGPNGTPNPYGEFVAPTEMSIFAHEGTRKRTGMNLNLEWRPSEDTQLWLRGYTTRYEETLFAPHLRLRTSNLNPATTVFTGPRDGFTTRAAVETETTFEKVKRPVNQVVLGGKHRFGEDWTIEGNINFTDAKEEKPSGSLLADEFQNQNFQNGLGNVASNAAFVFDFNDFWPVFDTAYDDPTYGWPGTGNIGDPSFYPFYRVRHEFSYVDEDTQTIDLNLSKNQELFGLSGYLKAGVKFLDRDKFVDDQSMRYSPTSTIFLSDYFVDGATRLPYGVQTADVIGHVPIGPKTGRYADLYSRQLGVTHNVKAWEAAFDKYVGRELDQQYDPLTGEPDPATLIKDPTQWTFDENGSRENSFEDDFVLNEKISSFYLMGEYSLNPKVKVVAGARVEATDAELSGVLVQDDRANGTFDVVPTGLVKESFTDVLPNAQMSWNVRDDIQVRASITSTIGRPDYTYMTPTARQFRINNGSTTGIYTGSIQMGNPGLKPYESNNFDASVAYYLPRNAGMLMLGFFYKDVTNPIYAYGYNAVLDTDVELTVPGMERTTVNGMNVVTYRGYTFESMSVSTRQNAESGEISGFEATYQQDFTFLPAPFDGFGLVANAAWMDSDVTIFGREDVKTPFFKQPDLVANVQVYYQQKGFEARVAWHFQDNSLGSVGSDPLLDQYVREREQLDAKIGYKINDTWGIFVEGRDLTNEPYRTYMAYSRDSLAGSGNEFPGYESTGATYYFGLNYHFGN